MHCNRREFVKGGVAALTAASLPPAAWTEAQPLAIGVQLYTVRKECEKDFAAALKQVAAIGYRNVELAGFYGRSAAQTRRLLDDSGLDALSAHFGYVGESEWAKNVEEARTCGAKHIVCPWIPARDGSRLDQAKVMGDDFRRGAELLTGMAQRAQQAGLVFGYHNHNYEFRRFGDATGLDLLMRGSDPKLVRLELDCFWCAAAGFDPQKVLGEYTGRIASLHVKDRKAGMPRYTHTNAEAHAGMTEVGSGALPWRDIFNAAQKAGAEFAFVEHDDPANAMESIKASFDWLKKNGFGG